MKITSKTTRESRNLLIALLIGDGSINKANGFRISHGQHAREYLEWKVNLMNRNAIGNSGVNEGIQSCGYVKGTKYYYTRLKTTNFIKLLRRIIYKPIKNYSNIRLLNRLDTLGLAIWYMDDGHINIRKTNNKVHGFYIKIATCLPKDDLQIIIDWFKSKWDVQFYPIKEGKQTYSLCCGTKEGIKFINLIKEHVETCPSMLYKIQYNLEERERCLYTKPSFSKACNKPEKQGTTISSEDIVSTSYESRR